MAPSEAVSDTILHASCVAVGPSAVLIRGASGSGKSALSLSLLALGATLVADDRVCLRATDDGIEARAPRAIAGLIEARGIGLLRADVADAARITCVVDLDTVETDRLPRSRQTVLLGQSLTLLYRVDAPHFAPALKQFLISGRQNP